jgi:hypothetical protein
MRRFSKTSSCLTELRITGAQGVGCVFAELMLRRPFMGGPFQRGGHTDQRVTEDSREQLRYRRKHLLTAKLV